MQCVAQPHEVQCIAPGVLRSFLEDKWIPPRDPVDMEETGVRSGHLFTLDFTREDPRSMMADWMAYMFGRPREAVPKAVRARCAGAHLTRHRHRPWVSTRAKPWCFLCLVWPESSLNT